MKKGSWSILTIITLGVILLATACGGGKSTTSTNPPTTTTKPPTTTTTTNPPTTTTNPPTTTTNPPTTTSGGATLPATAVAITDHTPAVLTSYNGLCLMCHGAGLANAFPTAPSWDGKASGSTVNTGVYTIAAGSPADHTGRTADQCTQSGCHAVPGATTTPPTSTTTTPPTTTTTAPPTTTTTTPPTTTTTTTPPPSSTVISGLTYVNLTTDGFQPPTLTVKVGTTITFTNNLEGTVELRCDGLGVDASILRGQQFSYTVKTAGSFTFTTDEGGQWTLTVVA
jgi:plastocyanin